MDYYSRKGAFNREIQRFIADKENSNKKIRLARLEIMFGQKYGFGKNIIIKALEPYAKIGLVELTEDMLIIREKKIQEVHADNSNSPNTNPLVSKS